MNAATFRHIMNWYLRDKCNARLLPHPPKRGRQPRNVATEVALTKTGPVETPKRRSVIIVGAGTSGLSLAFYLRRQGLQPIILEENEAPGSAWQKRHTQLRLNTHRWLSALPGKRLPRKLGAFVSRQDYMEYLERYACWRLSIPGHFHAPGIALAADPSVGIADTADGSIVECIAFKGSG